jgi:hypothetical protein
MGDVEGWWSIGREVIVHIGTLETVRHKTNSGCEVKRVPNQPHEAGHELCMQSLSGLGEAGE